ncbi:hypothetical protein [Desulfosporosinus sp.]|uniref:hypothetical protein n=1 Tax=Desulfosporosinus sp. TaxID=157907 RepID=UPI0023251CB1|nr:hypothetical protein [Desulfosporosinus sp.]MCO5387537.1 hypothetical protein [Desulfosporosinus sp.]MDA8223121.1 hypothetical protein [Desulfitobacterium hafniense]
MREVFVPLDLQIVSIEYPGKHGYVGLDSHPLEYKKNYGVNPYKAMSLHVNLRNLAMDIRLGISF